MGRWRLVRLKLRLGQINGEKMGEKPTRVLYTCTLSGPSHCASNGISGRNQVLFVQISFAWSLLAKINWTYLIRKIHLRLLRSEKDDGLTGSFIYYWKTRRKKRAAADGSRAAAVAAGGSRGQQAAAGMRRLPAAGGS